MTRHATHVHVVPVRVYVTVFGTLLALTALTTAAAFVDLGPFNNVVALGIAACKASLVVLFFMHVRYSSKLIGLAVVAGLAWLAILVVLSLSDYWTRDWLGVLGH